MRAKIYLRLLIAASATSAFVAGGTTPGKNPNRLVVHEWGTFTTIPDENGVALEWRPLATESDLPSFVYTIDKAATGAGLRHGPCVKCDLSARVRMETPVLYFYADYPMDVTLKVDFPAGKITEWYPSARVVSGSSLDWGRFTVATGIQAELLHQNTPSHYYAARNVDAALVRICTQSKTEYEKFLFYRGVGTFDLPLRVGFEGNQLHLQGEDVGQVIVFENRGGKCGFRLCGADEVVQRPVLDASIERVCGELEALLVGQGLYEKEAQAMIDTWRDSWFEEGLRVFYVLPRKTTDAVLPLTIEPQPAELVRVLVGRVEIITPEMETVILDELTNGDPAVAFKKQSRFAEPVLKRLLVRAHDSALKVKIERLLNRSLQN